MKPAPVGTGRAAARDQGIAVADGDDQAEQDGNGHGCAERKKSSPSEDGRGVGAAQAAHSTAATISLACLQVLHPLCGGACCPNNGQRAASQCWRGFAGSSAAYPQGTADRLSLHHADVFDRDGAVAEEDHQDRKSDGTASAATVGMNMVKTAAKSPRWVEKATKLMFTARSISSIDIRMTMTFFRFTKMLRTLGDESIAPPQDNVSIRSSYRPSVHGSEPRGPVVTGSVALRHVIIGSWPPPNPDAGGCADESVMRQGAGHSVRSA